MKCRFYSTNYFYFTVILLTNKMKEIYCKDNNSSVTIAFSLTWLDSL